MLKASMGNFPFVWGLLTLQPVPALQARAEPRQQRARRKLGGRGLGEVKRRRGRGGWRGEGGGEGGGLEGKRETEKLVMDALGMGMTAAYD